MTAEQRRRQDKDRYDAYLAGCPSRKLLDLLSDKWVTLSLTALADGPQRYSDIARTIAGVSPKMLTQTLRKLERSGMVSRAVEPTVPVTVTYSITPLAQSLMVIVSGLKEWAQAHMDDVTAAQQAYDLRRSTS